MTGALMDFFELIRRLTVTALFSDDILSEQLVLKGGNAMALALRLGGRSSLDIDFSLAGDFDDAADAERRARKALEERFDSAGYRVFDFSFKAKPKIKGDDQRPWWGGYQIEFKLMKVEDYHRLAERPVKRSIQAERTGRDQQRKLVVDISKNEYITGSIEHELDHYTIRVYTPSMVAAEKLRALCQQMDGYEIHGRNARARDFYDIYVAITDGEASLADEAGQQLVRAMFEAKRVPLAFLGKLETEREFHRPDWANVVSAVPGELKEFDFYFDFVLGQVRALEALWNE
jgi:predicted nucleotidyltransferase component of viral defense system